MLDIEQINLESLPSVSIEDWRHLPETSCIYFAIDAQGIVQYIGRSVNLRQRWINHHRKKQLACIGGVKIAYLSISNLDLLPELEKALIDWFDPKLNAQSLPAIDGQPVETKQVEKTHSIQTPIGPAIVAVLPHVDPIVFPPGYGLITVGGDRASLAQCAFTCKSDAEWIADYDLSRKKAVVFWPIDADRKEFSVDPSGFALVCPACGSDRVQSSDPNWKCANCGKQWRKDPKPRGGARFKKTVSNADRA
jgi:hypothetical protein